MRLAIVGLALAVAACGQQTPTATVAIFAPAAHETRQGVLAEQRDATRTEERASRSRRHATTTTQPAVLQRTKPTTGKPPGFHARKYANQAVAPAGGCGPGKKSRPVMVACWTPIVARYPWPNVNRVWNVMACESEGDQTATGIPTRYGRARGLMQILNGPYDPAANVARAWEMSRGGTDWSLWDCA